MPTLPKEELLSAYLDGELSAGELAQVEQWLADEPQLRRLHDELRNLRGTLKSLPSFKLPDNFASRVQRAAEERMLSTNRIAGLVNSAATNGHVLDVPHLTEAVAFPAKPAWRERIRRPIAWSTMVLAAALLLMFLNPDQSPEGGAVGPGDSSNHVTASDTKPREAGSHEISISARPDDKHETQTADSTAGKTPDSQVPAGLAGISIRVTPDGFAADGLLVVNCDITLKALREGAFRNLLKQARIDWETDDAPPTPPAGEETVGKETNRPHEVQVVYVEANAAQIERVLHNLNSQAAAFPNVALVPVPGADWQHTWQARYERQGHPTQTADSEGEAAAGSSQPIRKSGPIKGPPIKGPPIDANPSDATTSTEPPAQGRAWSIEVPTARPPGDAAEPKAAATEKERSADPGTAMLRVLFVLRILGS